MDVGLPDNAENQENYTRLSPELIAPIGVHARGPPHQRLAPLPRGHGGPPLVDGRGNQATVLDYVTSLLAMPVAQKEVVIRDLALRVLGEGHPWTRLPGMPGKREIPPAPRPAYTLSPTCRWAGRGYWRRCRGFLLRHGHRRRGLDQPGNPLKTRGILTGETVVEPPGRGPDPGKVRPDPHPLGPGGFGRGGKKALAAGGLHLGETGEGIKNAL